MSDSCGAWQAVQSPAETGPWGNFASPLSLWQEVHRSFSGCARSFGWSEECGSWQVVHIPSFTGG